MIRAKLEKVSIKNETLKDYEKKLVGSYYPERSRRDVRNDLIGKLNEIEDLLDLDDDFYSENLADLCAGLYDNIETLIIEFNNIFNLEIEDTERIRELDKYTYRNRDINFEDIGWEFADVNVKGDLQNVLNGLEIESFKNYEPYHNGNSRSSRKVPKPHDEHFVNFRSY